MRDEKAVHRTRARGPAAHARRGARTLQIDRRGIGCRVPRAVVREVSFVRTPTEFGRLQALVHEGLARPGIDELARRFAPGADLRIALGNVDDAHVELLCEYSPVFTRRGRSDRPAGIGSEVEQRLLDEVRDEPRVRAMSDHGSGGVGPAQCQRSLAQGIVAPVGSAQPRRQEAAGPGLDAGVEIEHAARLAPSDQGEAGYVDRQVQQDVPLGQARREQRLEVVLRDRLRDALDAAGPGNAEVVRAGVDHAKARGGQVKLFQQQRQDALADRAETQQQDATTPRRQRSSGDFFHAFKVDAPRRDAGRIGDRPSLTAAARNPGSGTRARPHWCDGQAMRSSTRRVAQRGQRTHMRSGCFMRPACSRARSPQPQK
jgi:hypothetical protein